jgi:hypothetical protein
MRNLIIILTAALVFMTSCSSSKRKNYILLVDNSKTISEATLDKYIGIMQQTILPNMGRYDRMTIQFIDECSMTQSERVFAIDLAAMDFTNKADGLNNAEDSSKARIKRFLADSIQMLLRTTILAKREERKNCGNYTDIINALNEATPLLTHEKSYSSTKDEILNNAQGEDNFTYENCIIIFSDMVNENKEKTFDFTQFGKYNEVKINGKLDELNKLNKIPDLSGCNILIYGATSTSESGIYANRQIENCKIFWQNFFHEGGAELKGYGYDSRKEITDYMTDSN